MTLFNSALIYSRLLENKLGLDIVYTNKYTFKKFKKTSLMVADTHCLFAYGIQDKLFETIFYSLKDPYFKKIITIFNVLINHGKCGYITYKPEYISLSALNLVIYFESFNSHQSSPDNIKIYYNFRLAYHEVIMPYFKQFIKQELDLDIEDIDNFQKDYSLLLDIKCHKIVIMLSLLFVKSAGNIVVIKQVPYEKIYETND